MGTHWEQASGLPPAAGDDPGPGSRGRRTVRPGLHRHRARQREYAQTILRICEALHITPDEVLSERETAMTVQQEELLARRNACSPKDRETALRLLSVYLQSLGEE